MGPEALSALRSSLGQPRVTSYARAWQLLPHPSTRVAGHTTACRTPLRKCLAMPPRGTFARPASPESAASSEALALAPLEPDELEELAEDPDATEHTRQRVAVSRSLAMHPGPQTNRAQTEHWIPRSCKGEPHAAHLAWSGVGAVPAAGPSM
eukprot:11369869-Alexandrium_andersonii.AAC.1